MATDRTYGAGMPAGTTLRREDWLTDGLVSGFIATFIMTVAVVAAYGIASAIGNSGDSGIAQSFWALTNNLVTERTGDQVALAVAANFAVGLIFAVIYAYFVEPMLSGRGWRRGMLFSLIPWLLSLVIFLPLVGGGVLGFAVGAGFLPILGNLILHLIYGGTLGFVYALTLEDGLEPSESERRNAASAERGAAVGVVAGVVLGLVGGWLLSPHLARDLGQGWVIVAGALIGGAGGLAAGSFLGMGMVRNPS